MPRSSIADLLGLEQGEDGEDGEDGETGYDGEGGEGGGKEGTVGGAGGIGGAGGGIMRRKGIRRRVSMHSKIMNRDSMRGYHGTPTDHPHAPHLPHLPHLPRHPHTHPHKRHSLTRHQRPRMMMNIKPKSSMGAMMADGLGEEREKQRQTETDSDRERERESPIHRVTRVRT